MQTLISIWLLFYCLSFGFWFLGNTLGMSDIVQPSANFNVEQAKFYVAGNETKQTNATLIPGTIFGDILTGIKMFWTIFTAGAIVDMLSGLGFNQYFILPIQVIIGFVQVLGLWYLVTGRGS